MAANELVLRGALVLPDRVLRNTALLVRQEHVLAVGPQVDSAIRGRADVPHIDAGRGYIVPGYIDLHVHGGAGADFMDGTAKAFHTALRAHLRHGTTSIVPTTTVARHEQILAMFQVCRSLLDASLLPGSRRRDLSSSPPALTPDPRPLTPCFPRVLGAHLYGPYFAAEARGCHPAGPIRPLQAHEYTQYLAFADTILTATIAPELPGAEEFVRACTERDIRTNVGHSHATFDQVAAAVRWGARHVDHLFCAMSDKARLRAAQPYPMRGGLLEATLYFDELTTEVIADGQHLSADLLLLAYKLKGPNRLALVTDTSRALDMPDGPYIFGPQEGGEPFVSRDGVGLMPNSQSLASSVRGMDHMVRTFHRLTGVPLPEVVRMATLTPARILGLDHRLGSLEPGKLADLLVLDEDLNVRRVFIGGQEIQT